MEKTVFITGATSGIGKASAKIFAKNGFKVVICGRRAGRLKQLQEKISSGSNVEYLVFDVRDKDEVLAKISSLPESFRNIDILINNAGNAHGLDTIDEGNLEDWDAMIDINVKGLLYVSKAIIPGMTKRKSGHIINIGSVAGKEVYPKGNVYCASKFALRGYSESLGQELLSKNVEVYTVHPGAIQTNITRHGIGWQDPVEQECAARVLHQISRNTARQAAKTIIKGIEKGNKRILIGSDAMALDLIARWLPSLHTRILRFFLSKMEKRLMKKIQQESFGSQKAVKV